MSVLMHAIEELKVFLLLLQCLLALLIKFPWQGFLKKNALDEYSKNGGTAE